MQVCVEAAPTNLLASPKSRAEVTGEYNAPDTLKAVVEAFVAVSLVPVLVHKRLALFSTNRVPSKYGIEPVCQVVVPVPPFAVESVPAEITPEAAETAPVSEVARVVAPVTVRVPLIVAFPEETIETGEKNAPST